MDDTHNEPLETRLLDCEFVFTLQKEEKEQKSTNKKIFRPRLFEDMKNEMANHGSVYIWLSRLVNESASQSIITELFYVGIGRLLWCFCCVG
jgi:hypothetical protein